MLEEVISGVLCKLVIDNAFHFVTLWYFVWEFYCKLGNKGSEVEISQCLIFIITSRNNSLVVEIEFLEVDVSFHILRTSISFFLLVNFNDIGFYLLLNFSFCVYCKDVLHVIKLFKIYRKINSTIANEFWKKRKSL